MARKEGEEEEEEEALRLKSLAEEKYKLSNLKSALKYAKRAQDLCPNLAGVSELVTALKILRVVSKTSSGNPLDWYKILQVEPFAHINTIKKQYKKLALILHPDKNPFVASEEAFKHVGEAFRVLSDKIRRKEYDLRLRISLQNRATALATTSENVVAGKAVETFWTACSTCRLFHQFERQYIGHNLMCPGCKKSFLAVEVVVSESEGEGRVRIRAMTRRMSRDSLEKEKGRGDSVERSRNLNAKRRIVGSVSDSKATKRVKTRQDMTLAEMQLEAKRKSLLEKKKKEMMKEKLLKEKTKEIGKENEKRNVTLRSRNLKIRTEKEKMKEKDNKVKVKVKVKLKVKEKEKEKKEKQRAVGSKASNRDIMAVEDSDFYDFDKDRMERSFKKGQVWAVYDDDDGMPRHYGLIDEVVSVNPFEVKMSWLDLMNNGDGMLIGLEKLGFHVSCGRFKVSKKTSVNSVNIFSHLVDCERVAREIYRIYPKKGSVWALYHEGCVDGEGNRSLADKRSYDIVVFLTSYSEMHGLSMAYLEKVDGFKTVFRRCEIGPHAIRWLEKEDVRLFSHQVPARKLLGTEAPDLSKDCWELDPASLPSDLLGVGWVDD